jgi:hypothetical protein
MPARVIDTYLSEFHRICEHLSGGDRAQDFGGRAGSSVNISGNAAPLNGLRQSLHASGWSSRPNDEPNNNNDARPNNERTNSASLRELMCVCLLVLIK